METGMTTRTLVMLSGAIEVIAGVAFTALPDRVATLLLGSSISDIDRLVIRSTGIVLISLGVAWWPREEIVTRPVISSLFAYNLFAALYFGYLRVGGGFVGHLLWPACVLHALLAFLSARPAYELIKRA
jgi:hypothetical protein